MPKVDPEIEAFARIKVIGVGGSGGNAINHMVNSKVKGVEFVAINTDAQDLHSSGADVKVHLGKNMTYGLGAGGNPDMGKRAAEETIEQIQSAIKGANMVFIACGMGGGTGTGAGPIVAKVAKDAGALTVGVVTKPFFFEGASRMRVAEQGTDLLEKSVDALIVIPNNRLLNVIEKTTTMNSAFAMCDDILRQAVEGISDLITSPGRINLDFADIRAVMHEAGSALMGIGSASGENRAVEAAKMAINSPLLDISIEGARGVLFAIAGADDLTLLEVQEAAKVITESVHPEARIFFGTIVDSRLKKNEIKITVIATGFPQGEGDTTRRIPPVELKELKLELNDENNVEPVEEKDEPRRVIFNKPKKEEVKPSVIKPIDESAKPDKKKEDDEDDWSSLPPFLRRSRLK
ncbi:MAG: cell division protein FtsZ [bacterium]|nr:cell division protein FtsZ [bacterium]